MALCLFVVLPGILVAGVVLWAVLVARASALDRPTCSTTITPQVPLGLDTDSIGLDHQGSLVRHTNVMLSTIVGHEPTEWPREHHPISPISPLIGITGHQQVVLEVGMSPLTISMSTP